MLCRGCVAAWLWSVRGIGTPGTPAMARWWCGGGDGCAAGRRSVSGVPREVGLAGPPGCRSGPPPMLLRALRALSRRSHTARAPWEKSDDQSSRTCESRTAQLAPVASNVFSVVTLSGKRAAIS